MFPQFSHFFYHEQDQIKGSKLLKFLSRFQIVGIIYW